MIEPNKMLFDFDDNIIETVYGNPLIRVKLTKNQSERILFCVKKIMEEVVVMRR